MTLHNTTKAIVMYVYLSYIKHVSEKKINFPRNFTEMRKREKSQNN